jgi:hypothetical protein
MKSTGDELQIPLQVDSEIRIRNTGEIIIDNPEAELAEDTRAADAFLSYRFDHTSGLHILRLLEPVADHKHLRVHRRGD